MTIDEQALFNDNIDLDTSLEYFGSFVLRAKLRKIILFFHTIRSFWAKVCKAL